MYNIGYVENLYFIQEMKDGYVFHLVKLFLATKSGPSGKAHHGSPELDFTTLSFPL